MKNRDLLSVTACKEKAPKRAFPSTHSICCWVMSGSNVLVCHYCSRGLKKKHTVTVIYHYISKLKNNDKSMYWVQTVIQIYLVGQLCQREQESTSWTAAILKVCSSCLMVTGDEFEVSCPGANGEGVSPVTAKRGKFEFPPTIQEFPEAFTLVWSFNIISVPAVTVQSETLHQNYSSTLRTLVLHIGSRWL